MKSSRRCSFLLMFLAAAAVLVACSDSTQPSSPRESAQATIGPAGGTVVTPSGAAGVQIPAGTFSQPVVVTVTQLASPSTPGDGPLPTALKQYPPYYEFTTSPAVPQFGDSVRVGVCQVTDPSSPFYAPEADHIRLRLAHAVGTTVEILDPVGVNDFLRCINVTAGRQPGSGWRVALASIVTRAGRLLNPSAAYAAHGGLGGKVKSFSPFGAVLDPCVEPPAFTIGATINGTIEPSDCNRAGLGLVDFFKLSLSTQTTLKVITAGSGIGEFGMLSLDRPAGEDFVFDRDTPSSDYAIVPAGNYLIGVVGGSGGGGPYTLAVQSATIPDGCTSGGIPTGPAVFLFNDVVVAGAITTNDCTGSQSNVFVDHYEITLAAGKSYQLAAIGNGLGLEVGLPDGKGGLTSVKSASNPSGSVSFTFQPSATAIYVVNVLGAPPGRTGPYTLRITKLP